ncbi:tripartite tricarboxylate transporter TctB family protein [Nesterenkonia sp. CL21]|nr:tripartite tricarboxylate transporter TctB family protein [Nesterenkonia sp. CL21]MDS2173521.1 tripartite tricarboxylate transporter TctB family protein [Nesterenkonia sp. CL21]OSM44038.1 hypothetical protein BCY76_004975 [Nesterenkonia sp. PF2B19]
MAMRNSQPAREQEPLREHLDDFEGTPQLDEPGPVDWWSPVVLAALAAVVIIPAVQLGLGSIARPGPGLWPFLNAMLVVAAIPLLLATRHRFHPPNRSELTRVALVAGPLLLFVPAYDWLGLIGAGAPVMLIVARFVARMRWRTSILIAVIAPAAVYALFALALGVNLRPF